MDPFLEINPRWEVFHGWFIRKLAEQSTGRARELGCEVDVERSVYGREPTGELVLIGELDLLAQNIPAFRSAYDLSYRSSWRRWYEAQEVPGLPLDEHDQAWVRQVLGS
jgi:hypothetical protein